ncbi:MAG: type II toxin-antitoxin system VapC family toxin [Pirellulales bacterium]
MIFTDLVDGETVFLDANILVYHFAPHPVFGQSSNALVRRIENQAIAGYTSTAVLSEVAHHLMTFEASSVFGWTSKVVQRLRQDPAAVQQLTAFHQAIAKVPQLGIHVLTIAESLIESAALVSRQTGLLSNDALIVAVMRENGLTNLASNDADFDRVAGLVRYWPS